MQAWQALMVPPPCAEPCEERWGGAGVTGAARPLPPPGKPEPLVLLQTSPWTASETGQRLHLSVGTRAHFQTTVQPNTCRQVQPEESIS